MLGNIADTKQREAVAALQSALQSGNEEEGKKAWGQVFDAITEKVKTDFEMYSTDTNVLAQRGYRQLTSEETEFYQNLAKAGKASDPKQAFTDLITTDGGMPETIIEDVYRNLLEEHPLLEKITFQNVKYLTKWLLNDHTRQKAAWGQINGEITQEIESAFKGVEITLLKLTAYLVCAGQGENQDRITLHLYVQKDGTIGKTQYYKGSEEIEAVYDYSSADKEKLEEDGRKKLKELQNYKKCTMTVDDIDLELGDIVSGYDAITDTQVIKPVTQKVVKCQNGKITIDYKIEGDD